jgi:hypothetical protein
VDIGAGAGEFACRSRNLPLVAAGLPQMPGNSGPDGLSFAKAGFRQLLALDLTGQDLRIGSRFTGERAVAVARALTIADMPANYIRYLNSDAKVFGAAVAAPPRTMPVLTLDGEVLGQFGSLTVPGQVWRTLQRLGSWVEPVLVNEWARLVRAYGERMGRMISPGEWRRNWRGSIRPGTLNSHIWLRSVRWTKAAS